MIISHRLSGPLIPACRVLRRRAIIQPTIPPCGIAGEALQEVHPQPFILWPVKAQPGRPGAHGKFRIALLAPLGGDSRICRAFGLVALKNRSVAGLFRVIIWWDLL